jgi:hypothetical protein
LDLNILVQGDLLTLQVAGNVQDARIYDVSGALWASSSQKVIPIGNLKSGTYFVKVWTNAGTAIKAFTKI